MSTATSWFVIVNPVSGNSSGKQKWTRIKRLLKEHEFTFDVAFTEHSAHSIELIESAVVQGFRKFICVGGDGTIHNTVNGIMKQSKCPSSDIHLGVIPVGTGNDWVRTHGIPKHIEKAIMIIKRQNLRQQDIGKIDFNVGNKPSVYFNNLAGVGFDGYVVSRVEKIKSFGSLAYILGALMGLFSARRFQTNVQVNSENISSSALMVLIGLCQYSGGGMQLTKEPQFDDGLFDISIAHDFNGFDIIKNILNLFNGKVVNSKKIENIKSNSIHIDITDHSQPFIQADGELIGQGGFRVSLVTKALSFYA